jgi:hypothetical protein
VLLGERILHGVVDGQVLLRGQLLLLLLLLLLVLLLLLLLRWDQLLLLLLLKVLLLLNMLLNMLLLLLLHVLLVKLLMLVLLLLLVKLLLLLLLLLLDNQIVVLGDTLALFLHGLGVGSVPIFVTARKREKYESVEKIFKVTIHKKFVLLFVWVLIVHNTDDILGVFGLLFTVSQVRQLPVIMGIMESVFAV